MEPAYLDMKTFLTRVSLSNFFEFLNLKNPSLSFGVPDFFLRMTGPFGIGFNGDVEGNLKTRNIRKSQTIDDNTSTTLVVVCDKR